MNQNDKSAEKPDTAQTPTGNGAGKGAAYTGDDAGKTAVQSGGQSSGPSGGQQGGQALGKTGGKGKPQTGGAGGPKGNGQTGGAGGKQGNARKGGPSGNQGGGQSGGPDGGRSGGQGSAQGKGQNKGQIKDQGGAKTGAQGKQQGGANKLASQGPNAGKAPPAAEKPVAAAQSPRAKTPAAPKPASDAPKPETAQKAPAATPDAKPQQARQTVVQIKPLARPARMRKRHRGIIVSFAFLVFLPIVVMSFYLWARSADQFASTTAFTVQRETGGSAVDLLGGLTQLSGGSSSDTDILYEFIQSQELVNRVSKDIDLRGHYQKNWDNDPLFSLNPDATLEDLVHFWQRIVRISYDQSANLIELQVLAFDAQTAQNIAQAIVGESQSMINALNAAAREDTIRYALSDLEEALARLKTAREALTAFRTRTQIVDPTADIQGRMGVLNNLQQQLAEALIEFDILSETTKRTDPRLQQAERRIEVIQDRIAAERQTFATAEAGQNGEDYPTLMAEFESLTVDREFAEEAYRAALAAVEIARSNAARKSRYLATYIAPTLAQTAEYPQRVTWVLLTALFSVLLWAIFVLIYYSVRDRQ